MSLGFSIRQKIGAALYDLPRFLWNIRSIPKASDSIEPWLLIRNRKEHLLADADRKGVHCKWEWTSDLHLAKVFPATGIILMKKALQRWPIILREEPERGTEIDVSFVIGHRGIDRLPHLLMTLRSIAGQRNIHLECLVVEQSPLPEISGFLPGWVRYIHTPVPDPEMLYSRSWAFNVGAREARGKVLILHDNDMLVAADYGSQILAGIRDGCEVVNLKRFIFYLTEVHSSKIFSAQSVILNHAPEKVIQNLQGGGSFGIKRETYFELGGFDEEFVGWGGEDIEFWQRALTRPVYSFTYIPILHLWHPPQQGKRAVRGLGQNTVHVTERRRLIPPEIRIDELRKRRFGNPQFLDPPYRSRELWESKD